MATIWNSADVGTGITLSGNGRNVYYTGSSTTISGRATTSKSTGKWYFEWYWYSKSDAACVFGLGNSSASLSGQIGISDNFAVGVNCESPGRVYYRGSAPVTLQSSSNSVWACAVDLDARLVWFKSQGGGWNAAGADPATGAGGLDISLLTGSLFPMFSTFAAGNRVRLNPGSSSFSMTPPSGFTAWDSTAPADNTVRIGVNLGDPSGPERPFLNLVKSFSAMEGVQGSTPFGASLINRDSNGWPTDLNKIGGGTFDYIRFGVSLTPLVGDYVILYDGTGTVRPEQDLVFDSEAVLGRVLCHVSSTSNGLLRIRISATNAAPNNVRNVRLVYVEADGVNDSNESLLNGGEVFNTLWKQRVTPFAGGCLRFMDWNATNTNLIEDWADRPSESWWSWQESDTNTRVPIEVMVDLCNELQVDGWFCVPAFATDDYVANMALYIYNNLDSNLVAWVEYYNECWLLYGKTSVNTPAAVLGFAAYPDTQSSSATFTGEISAGDVLTVSGISGSINASTLADNVLFGLTTPIPDGVEITAQLTGTAGSNGTYQLTGGTGPIASQSMTCGGRFSAAFQYTVMRRAQVAQIFEDQFGSSTRLKNVCGSQIGGSVSILAQVATDQGGTSGTFTGDVASHFDVYATAPYFIDDVVGTTARYYTTVSDILSTYTAQADSMISNNADHDYAACAFYTGRSGAKLKYACYEGGPNLVAGSVYDTTVSGQSYTWGELFNNVNIDPGMYDAMTYYLELMQQVGSNFLLYAHFNFVFPHGEFGNWGAMQDITETLSNSVTPKYNALVDFINEGAGVGANASGGVLSDSKLTSSRLISGVLTR